MPAPSFSSFPTLAAPITQESRGPSPPKKQKRSHHTGDERDVGRIVSQSKSYDEGRSDHKPSRKSNRDGDKSSHSDARDRDGHRRRDREGSEDDERRKRKERDKDRGKDRHVDRDRDRNGDKAREKTNQRETGHPRAAHRSDTPRNELDGGNHKKEDRERRYHEDRSHRHRDRQNGSQRMDQTGTRVATPHTLPVRDEEAGFFADTFGTGTGMHQADWKGIPRYRRETRMSSPHSPTQSLTAHKSFSASVPTSASTSTRTIHSPVSRSDGNVS